MLLCQLVCCFGLLQPLLYSAYFAGHAGIAFCAVSAGIVCLASPTCDWSQLHAGIVCLAYDWVTACWDSLSILLHAGIACLASLAYDWVITVGCLTLLV